MPDCKPVVLIHGTWGNGDSLSDARREFEARGYRCTRRRFATTISHWRRVPTRLHPLVCATTPTTLSRCRFTWCTAVVGRTLAWGSGRTAGGHTYSPCRPGGRHACAGRRNLRDLSGNDPVVRSALPPAAAVDEAVVSGDMAGFPAVRDQHHRRTARPRRVFRVGVRFGPGVLRAGVLVPRPRQGDQGRLRGDHRPRARDRGRTRPHREPSRGTGDRPPLRQRHVRRDPGVGPSGVPWRRRCR